QTCEGAIGHVIDFIIDDNSWAICRLVVETGHWYSRKEIVISPKHIDRIKLRGIQGICERDQGSHPGSTAIPCFSARRGIWRYPEFRLINYNNPGVLLFLISCERGPAFAFPCDSILAIES